MKYYAGVEFDKSFVKCSIVARDGTLLCRDTMQGQGEGIADCVSKLISMLVHRANVVLSGIGIVYENVGESERCRDGSVKLVAERAKECFSAPVLLLRDFNINNFNAAVFGD